MPSHRGRQESRAPDELGGSSTGTDHYRAASVFEGFKSNAMKRALSLALLYASDAEWPVLIEGESGTGKTRLARFIHANSIRGSHAFERFEAGVPNDDLAADDLFGHETGSFTGATRQRHGRLVLANRGTLFVDELNKASPRLQRLLISCIEDRAFRPIGADRDIGVDVRFIFATNTPFRVLECEENFYPDLLARIATYHIRLAPLRERRADIPQLANHFVHAHSKRLRPGRMPPSIHPELMGALVKAPWKYNLRELEDQLRLLMLSAPVAPELTLTHCRELLPYLCDIDGRRPPVTAEEFDSLIAQCGGKSEAAAMAGIDRKTFYLREKRARRANSL